MSNNNNRIYYSREAEIQARRERMTTVMLFMVLGLGIGTAMALLLAPSSGKEIRSELSSTLEGGLDTGREAASTTISRLEKEFAELRKRVEERVNER